MVIAPVFIKGLWGLSVLRYIYFKIRIKSYWKIRLTVLIENFRIENSSAGFHTDVIVNSLRAEFVQSNRICKRLAEKQLIELSY